MPTGAWITYPCHCAKCTEVRTTKDRIKEIRYPGNAGAIKDALTKAAAGMCDVLELLHAKHKPEYYQTIERSNDVDDKSANRAVSRPTCAAHIAGSQTAVHAAQVSGSGSKTGSAPKDEKAPESIQEKIPCNKYFATESLGKWLTSNKDVQAALGRITNGNMYPAIQTPTEARKSRKSRAELRAAPQGPRESWSRMFGEPPPTPAQAVQKLSEVSVESTTAKSQAELHTPSQARRKAPESLEKPVAVLIKQEEKLATAASTANQAEQKLATRPSYAVPAWNLPKTWQEFEAERERLRASKKAPEFSWPLPETWFEFEAERARLKASKRASESS